MGKVWGNYKCHGGHLAYWTVCAIISAAPFASFGHPPVDAAAVAGGHPTGHVGDHGGVTWPPQPLGIAVTGAPVARPPAEGARPPALAAPAGVFMVVEDFPDVRKILGKRFARVSEINLERTGREDGKQVVFFSHENNATVEVNLNARGGHKIKKVAPSEYQPEITDDEVAEATVIARDYFIGLGKGRVAALQGFGILAYKPEGKGFYDSRVIYVSFHADAEAPPEFAAWVDLSRRRVIRSREERS